MKHILLSIFAVLFVAACANQGQRGAGIEERSVLSRAEAERQAQREQELKREQLAQEGLQKGEVPVIRPIAGTDAVTGQAQSDPQAAQAKPGVKPDLLSQRSIYYEYDSYDIKDEYVPIIEAHARFLAGNPQARIAVQGNCDSRGSREYNVALGQRRADNVRRTLILLGVAEKQIQATSFGAEKPMALGQNETAWAKNRRSDVVYLNDTQALR